MVQIKEIKHGIASRVGDTIYINKVFNHDQKLKDFLINHELEHSTKLTLKDWRMDMKLFPNNKRYLKDRYLYFLRCYPSTWTEFLPVIILLKDRKVIFNIKLIILYSLALLLIWLLKLIIL